MADVSVETTGAEGVLFKQGGAHGGHTLFIQDGRLHYVYNFLGEQEQMISAPNTVPLAGTSLVSNTPAPGPWKTAIPRWVKPLSTSTTPRLACWPR
ncbi:arylsulfatase domain protein [Mycobacterium xenopi 4042]|uniref:Arylsulfatase domain protein n=1 Tax=Mycobacterium xenopi 4042 TaxID=1299334 RepID=X7YKF1_MYCXE|nr:arylsulfatase domain protein [Mycobacterium xenopi 4042]